MWPYGDQDSRHVVNYEMFTSDFFGNLEKRFLRDCV